jgi:hypothetical protein
LVLDFRDIFFAGTRLVNAVYTAIETHSPGARVIIPPRKDAVLSPTARSSPTQPDEHLLEIER